MRFSVAVVVIIVAIFFTLYAYVQVLTVYYLRWFCLSIFSV